MKKHPQVIGEVRMSQPFKSNARQSACNAVPLPQGTDLAQICVCQIDHLGDLLIITPFLVELRKFAPQARITLVVGRWCGELAEVLRAGGLVDECSFTPHG